MALLRLVRLPRPLGPVGLFSLLVISSERCPFVISSERCPFVISSERCPSVISSERCPSVISSERSESRNLSPSPHGTVRGVFFRPARLRSFRPARLRSGISPALRCVGYCHFEDSLASLARPLPLSPSSWSAAFPAASHNSYPTGPSPFPWPGGPRLSMATADLRSDRGANPLRCVRSVSTLPPKREGRHENPAKVILPSSFFRRVATRQVRLPCPLRSIGEYNNMCPAAFRRTGHVFSIKGILPKIEENPEKIPHIKAFG